MSRNPVLLVGGIGRMLDAYRTAAASAGLDLIHAETRLSGTPPHVAAVLVVTSACSHPLLTAARQLATAQQAPIFYLRQPSISALRRALAEVRCDA